MKMVLFLVMTLLLSTNSQAQERVNESYTFLDAYTSSEELISTANWSSMDEATPTEYYENVRTAAFKVQALSRVLRRGFVEPELKKAAKKLKKTSKFIEDSLGEIVYYREMHADLTNQSQFAPYISISAERVAESQSRFHSRVGELNEKVEQMRNLLSLLLNSERDLRKVYLDGMGAELRKIRKDLEDIDPTLLEDGTHELRRKIRWVNMYINYPRGLFGYRDPNAPTNRYTELFPDDANRPIWLDHEPVIELSDMIYRLGKVKDEGLLEHYVHQLEGTSSNDNQSTDEIIELTRTILARLFEGRLVEQVTEQLKE